MSNVNDTLEQAYSLIENDKTAEANLLLTSLLPEHDANPDVWWLLIHSAQTPQQGRLAVNRLREIAPNYPGLDAILEKIGEKQPVAVEKPIKATEKHKVSLLVRVLAFILVFVAAGTLFVFLLSNRIGNTSPAIAQQATQTPEITPTQDDAPTSLPFDDEATPTPETNFASQSFTTPQIAFLDQLSLSNNGYFVEDTVLVVTLCAMPGVEAGNAVRSLLETASDHVMEVPSYISNLDINIDDCFDTGNTLRTLTLPWSAVMDYAKNILSLQQLQALLTPKG